MSPRRAGPTPYCRTPLAIKVDEGLAVYTAVLGSGLSFRQAAAQLGLSPTTAWRRYHFLADWLLPSVYGVRSTRVPPQRGTAACPRGRPWIAELDRPGGPLHRP